MQHSLSGCFVDHPTLWKHIVLSLFLVLCGVLLCIALLYCICDGLLSRVFGIRFCLPFCVCFSYIIAAKEKYGKKFDLFQYWPYGRSNSKSTITRTAVHVRFFRGQYVYGPPRKREPPYFTEKKNTPTGQSIAE